MKRYTAIAVVELSGIADGLYCTDALLKKAPIAMIKSGTVSHGRYLIIIGGSTASVDESLQEALAAGQTSVLDHTFLPDVHPQVLEAVLGQRLPCEQDAVAILETETVAANVRAAELAGSFLRGRKEYVQYRIISRPHEALTRHLTTGTRFADTNVRELEGEEVS
jgi:microcompartment protein CcmL/EutN